MIVADRENILLEAQISMDMGCLYFIIIAPSARDYGCYADTYNEIRIWWCVTWKSV